jgi:glycosyltransferase involved in cell wall biosynthesis
MSAEAPLVSVIIPCFNATRYIPETLDCLRAQKFRDFEVILTNDGCPDTDNLERALEPYRNEVRYLKSGKRDSAAGSRNNGIRASRARYIALLDADDLWEPDYLSTHVDFLENNPSFDLVHSNSVIFGNTSWTGRTINDTSLPASETALREVVFRERIVYVGATARRESLVQAGLFDPQVWGGEDWDLWMRLLRNGGRAWYTGLLLCKYRLHEQNQSTRKLESLKNHIGVYRKHLSLPGLSSEQREWFESAMRGLQAEADLFEGKQALYRQQREHAIERLMRANAVMRSRKIGLAIMGLRFAPNLLYSYVHRRFPTEYIYLH